LTIVLSWSISPVSIAYTITVKGVQALEESRRKIKELVDEVVEERHN
jgi:DNA-binding PadR family transcriptional regulator